jgi:two-component system, LytTR family, sensor kinase
MISPLITNKKNMTVYAIVMLIILLLHFAILYFFFGFEVVTALADAGVYSAMIFLLGIGLWYIVKYLAPGERKIIQVWIDHFIAGVLLVTIWLFGSFYLLSSIFKLNPEYLEFLSLSLPWRFIYLLLVYAILVMVYYLINYYNRFHEKEMQEAELKQAVQQSELNMLKSQINPHFLFNSLNSIHSLIMYDPDKAGEMLTELSDFLRYTVRTNHNERVSLKDEMENIDKYLAIEKIRFGERLIVQHKVEAKCLGRKIPNMILQPVYENAIKHGVNESTETVTIQTKCNVVGGILRISISNNFTPGNISKKGAGVGLENIRKRLRLHYKMSDLLQVENHSGVFTVHISIPENNIHESQA